MDNEAAPNGGDRSVESVQDFLLVSSHRATIAQDQLSEMVGKQRAQAEAIVDTINRLREQLRMSETSRLTLEDENRRLRDQVVDLDAQLRHVHDNYDRLSDGYSSMMQVIENTHTSSVGLTQRIEAMLLQNDLGIGHRNPLPPVPRVEEFRQGVFAGHTTPTRHPVSPAVPHGYGREEPVHFNDPRQAALRPLTSFKSERY